MGSVRPIIAMLYTTTTEQTQKKKTELTLSSNTDTHRQTKNEKNQNKEHENIVTLILYKDVYIVVHITIYAGHKYPAGRVGKSRLME